MVDDKLIKKIDDAIWVAKELFERKKVSGSSANLSFIHEDKIYITGTGTCFGRLDRNSFSTVLPDGTVHGLKPSKELTLHKIYYAKDPKIKAVIHTHSFYSTLWTCIAHRDETDIIPEYTPYLKMKIGTIGLIPYAKPGSNELFENFKKRVMMSDGFILANHGPIIGAEDIMSAFYIIEELEESAHIAWKLRKEKGIKISQK